MEYERKKKEAADNIVARLERYLPGITEAIIFRHVPTAGLVVLKSNITVVVQFIPTPGPCAEASNCVDITFCSSFHSVGTMVGLGGKPLDFTILSS